MALQPGEGTLPARPSFPSFAVLGAPAETWVHLQSPADADGALRSLLISERGPPKSSVVFPSLPVSCFPPASSCVCFGNPPSSLFSTTSDRSTREAGALCSLGSLLFPRLYLCHPVALYHASLPRAAVRFRSFLVRGVSILFGGACERRDERELGPLTLIREQISPGSTCPFFQSTTRRPSRTTNPSRSDRIDRGFGLSISALASTTLVLPQQVAPRSIDFITSPEAVYWPTSREEAESRTQIRDGRKRDQLGHVRD